MNRPVTASPRPRYVQILSATAALLFAFAVVWIMSGANANAAAKSTPPAMPKAAPECGPDWAVVPSPNVATILNELHGVAVISANDIWAVGYSQEASQSSHTLIEHWNGLGWNVVPSPNSGTHNNLLQDITAISASDIWAVGGYENESVVRTLILHYDGSTWSIVTSPNDGSYSNNLLGVAAYASNDVWAVGNLTNSLGNARTLAMHWDGTSWDLVTTPNVNILGNYLISITIVSPNDVWAVGTYFISTNPTFYRNLTEHWDGTSWSIVASPNLGTDLNELTSVDAVSASEVWAVGTYQNTVNPQPMAMLWNGSSWNLIATPNVGSGIAGLLSVTALASNDVWAVGVYTSGSAQRALIEHWNGSAWTQVTSPNPGFATRLNDIAAASPTDIWGVGQGESNGATLTERYNPCSGSPTPTATATSIPTHCAIEFTDVAQGSTFYDYIRCMVCRGIINGYTTGCETGNPCFRPNTDVTRGQLSKIVANAANFNEPAGAQQFQDVPVGSTFYDFVWRLANRNIVGGYACGGPGEPCVGPDNLPYFRPNGNATRGQISKIVSNAANFTDPPGAQLFEDVPPSHTFFDFVQRLANRGVMNGYACGGTGEPCNPPNNLSYFRPPANATRGQTSKIVSNTFFPACSIP